MKKTNKFSFKYLFSVILMLFMLVAATGRFNTTVVNATSATTHTRTTNADGVIVQCQDGYLPETIYDKIGLVSPQDMVIDTVIENGEEVEYGYVLDKGSSKDNIKPFILKFNLNDVVNTIERIEIGKNLPEHAVTPRIYGVEYISSSKPSMVAPSGLWIQELTIDGVKKKELYIADPSATYDETIKATNEELALGLSNYTQKYTGLIWRVQFDLESNKLQLNKCDILHEPYQAADRSDYDDYLFIPFTEEMDDAKKAELIAGRQVIPTKRELTNGVIVCKIDECKERIVPLGQYLMKEPSFGQSTQYFPNKVAVDSSGNIFVASGSTSAGMVQLSYSGEFVSFFVVNTVAYNFLYQFIKSFGTDEQLEKLDPTEPSGFTNVYIDNDDLVYSVTASGTVVFDKYSTQGSSILETPIMLYTPKIDVADSYVTEQGLIFLIERTGLIYVFAPTGQLIFYFGSSPRSNAPQNSENIVGFFSSLESIVVDKSNRIWVIDSKDAYIQTFEPTNYTNSIITAITKFNEQEYEASGEAWKQVLKYDSLSVLANDGLGKAYYYDQEYDKSLEYFAVSKNRTLYSNVFWEQRNDFLQQNLSLIIIIALGVICIFALIAYLFNNNKKLKLVKEKVTKIKEHRWFKDLTVGFRLIVKPNDTFYEMKNNKRGSVWGATIYYVLGIAAFMLNTYCYALPFQYITSNQLNLSTVFFATVAVLAVFVLCNYLVSAINDGEGTFKDIYKFTGYCLLPMIICLPIGVGISYGLTLNEEVILTVLKALGFWGSGILLVIGVLETHNYTFGQTVKNILLTIIFMILFVIICMVVVIMVDQIKTLIEQIWKEVKLRVGWY